MQSIDGRSSCAARRLPIPATLLALRRSHLPLAELVDEVGTELAPRSLGEATSPDHRVGDGVIAKADREQLSRALVSLAATRWKREPPKSPSPPTATATDRLALTVTRERPGLAPRARETCFSLSPVPPAREAPAFACHRAGGRPHPWWRYPARENERQRYVLRHGTTC